MDPKPVVLSKNKALLTDFVIYCTEHPQLRFWQALCGWSGLRFICSVHTLPEYLDQSVQDTFYWEGKNG